ncbi:hypothetical protein [Sporosarcina sp. UB5]|uniref:hypothetical protein n=1 Tax=Sporosarcina sp. UB5 TaxID=3047463 RepID=UPI003D7AC09B
MVITIKKATIFALAFLFLYGCTENSNMSSNKNSGRTNPMDDPVNITEEEANEIALQQAIAEGNEVETIILQDIKFINSKMWDEYVEQYNYDSEVSEHFLQFLKDKKKQTNKEGIHTIEKINLVSIELTNDKEFSSISSNGDYVYDVLLDMKVHKESEFYMNGVTHHVYVINKTSDGLKIETVYFKGLVDDK